MGTRRLHSRKTEENFGDDCRLGNQSTCMICKTVKERADEMWNFQIQCEFCGGGYGNLDLIKMPLALLIVFRHIGQMFCFEDVYWRYFINTISTIGVTSFFIISGFLFFRKPADEVRLKKQVLRILKLYICWSLIYSPVIIYRYLKAGIAFPQAIVDFIQKSLFSGSYYHLWYLPSLIVAIYIVYILREKTVC